MNWGISGIWYALIVFLYLAPNLRQCWIMEIHSLSSWRFKLEYINYLLIGCFDIISVIGISAYQPFFYLIGIGRYCLRICTDTDNIKEKKESWIMNYKKDEYWIQKTSAVAAVNGFTQSFSKFLSETWYKPFDLYFKVTGPFNKRTHRQTCVLPIIIS